MKRVLTVLAALAAVLAIVSGAGAAGSPRQHRIARLERAIGHLRVQRDSARAAFRMEREKVISLETQAGSLQAEVAGLTSQNAAFKGQVASLTSQNGSLETTLAQRTSERDAARKQAAALQAQLDAIPAPLAVAVEQVGREVAWAQHGTSGSTWAPHGPSADSTGQLTALSAMNYVVGHVSASAYGYLEVTGGALPAATPDAVLAAQAGFCGSAALTFAALVKRFGYAVRSVQFHFKTPDGAPDNHIAVEVYYDDAWHYFDPTFGVFWTNADGDDVLSIADVRAGAGVEHKDAAAFTNLLEDPWFNGDDVAFETGPATDVEIDQQPFTG
jgi:hypothetical protein